MAWEITAYDAIAQTMRSMGLAAPEPSIYFSQDPTVIQFLQLANDAGQQLVDDHDWRALDNEVDVTLTPGQAVYPLSTWAPGMNKIIADAQWNRTTRLPVIGSLQEWEWQMLKARDLAGTTFTMMFRVDGDNIVLLNAPSTAQRLIIPYQSRFWVRSQGYPVSYTPRDHIVQDDDQIAFDPQLFRQKLKLLWLQEKRFDTTAAKAQYDELLEKAKSKDTPARTLSLRSNGEYHYLGNINIPDTRYGS